jgi:hypothetical protein
MEFAFRSCNPLQRTLNDCYRGDSVSRILQASYKSEYRSLLPPSFSRREAVHPVSAAIQPPIPPIPYVILNQSILSVLSSPVFAYTELRSANPHLRTASSPRPLRVLSDLCVKIPRSLNPYPSATPKTSTHPRNSRRMNTCKSVSKQMSLTIFRMNTYVKTGGGGDGDIPASHSIAPCYSSTPNSASLQRAVNSARHSPLVYTELRGATRLPRASRGHFPRPNHIFLFPARVLSSSPQGDFPNVSE